MKKNGFTLAEVLITLAIIGVVAVLTLPALMTNAGEQQAKSALKKGINTLTEAAQMNSAIEGFDYATLTSTSVDDDEAQSLYGLLVSRAAVDTQKSANLSTATVTQQGYNSSTYGSYQGSTSFTANNYAIFFRDGTSLLFNQTGSYAAGKTGRNSANVVEDDGLVYGIAAIYDTNGLKGPNILSNCEANTLGANSDNTSQDLDTACSKSRRVIKDQFGVRLRGVYVVPNGAAARWAFAN